MLRFSCQNCGKAYVISPEHAGKKTVCSSCGVKFQIPGKSPSSVSAAASRPAPKPEPKPDPPPTPELDVYGLEEEPAAPPTSGSLALGASAPTSSAGEGPAPIPKRMKAYKPLSETQKKKIAKRADKLDRLKPSTAGVGISFGAMLAFALVGWRIYRVVHRVQRAADGITAHQSALEDPSDPKAVIVEMDKEVASLIAQPSTAEARDWLDPAKYPNHGVAEMAVGDARAMVAGFYDRGAQKVYVIDPNPVPNAVMTAQLAVELPQDPSQRKQCLEWAAKYEGPEDAPVDLGQKYLLISRE
jgi:hypothetical protein